MDRDYNHPSVIMYSIGNEVSEPAKEEGIRYTKDMVDYLHGLDNTRAVTGGFNLTIITNSARGKDLYDAENGGMENNSDKKMQGMNSTVFNMITNIVGTSMNNAANSKKADAAISPAMDLLDICGYNYASGRYPLDGKLHPDRIIVGSETFPQTIARNWAMVKQYPYLVGDFMWTAWDYLGETGLGAWAYTPDGKGFNKPYPWLLADSGAMDILGDANAELFHAAAVWDKLDAPAICVQPINHDVKPAKMVWRGSNAIPSWSWKGCEGRKATVEVYCNAARVELFLNGAKVGAAKVKDCKAVFKVKYVPGTLEAAAYDAGGREIGRTRLTSAAEAQITLLPERKEAVPGEIIYIPVVLADKAGNVESNADGQLTVTVEGGELLGFGSANPRTEERFDAGAYTTYYGRALAVVRAGTGGSIRITVSDGAQQAATELPIR